MSIEAAPRRTTIAEILDRALEWQGKAFAPEGARFILDLGIRDDDKQRTLDLLSRRSEGRITDEEKAELNSYIQADNVLSILRAKALLALGDEWIEPHAIETSVPVSRSSLPQVRELIRKLTREQIDVLREDLSSLDQAGPDDLSDDELADQEAQRRLFEAGLLAEIKPPARLMGEIHECELFEIGGELLSEMIVRERR